MVMEQTSGGAGQQPARYVFVYGTLRRGGSNDINRLAPAPVWVGEASIAGTLYDFGRYPGVVLGGEGRVVGEVYGIDASLERVLDEINRAVAIVKHAGRGVRNVANETYTKVSRPAKAAKVKTTRTVKRAARKSTVKAKARPKKAARRAK